MTDSNHTDHTDLDLVAATAAHLPTERAELGAVPRRRLAVLTCMDARIVPHAMLGLATGDLHVVRNAGARVTNDTERSLMLSTRLLGVRQVAVIAHTDCGNTGTDEQIAAKLAAAGLPEPPGPLHGTVDLEQAVVGDVRRLRTGGLLADGVSVRGYVYDVGSGRLREVPVGE